MPCQGFIYIKHIGEGDFGMINECLFLCVYQHLQNPALVQQILTFIFWQWSAENCWHKMIKFRRALSYFPQMHTDLYFSVWPFNHWQQSISARWLDALNMCWSTFGSCGFRQILKIYFSYKALLLAFLKYLQHRSEGLPKLIWSWNWLYVQFF